MTATVMLPSPFEVARSDLRDARLRAVLTEHHALAHRILRRLGVEDAWVDEAVSRVFDVVRRRLDDVEDGRERAFVSQVAVRVASNVRRSGRAWRNASEALGRQERASSHATPEEELARRERVEQLDRMLASLDDDAREVFVLHEIEQLTRAEIASALGIPAGTVASRLRRAREQLNREIEQLRKREARR